MVQRLHLIDGTWELFRAHFSKRPDHRTPAGKAFKATAGLVSSLLALLADEAEAVTHLAVAFDNPIRSFRNDLYDGYKTEAGVDPDLLAQLDDAEAAVRALGVTVWSMDRWECDDGLATGAARFRDEVRQVRICSPDKDLAACVRGEHVVVVDRQRKTVLDEARLRATRGIGPESVPDYLALVGDTADGIPGVPGFGEKTASALLGRFVHLESIPAHAADWGVTVRNAAGLAATLAQHHDAALLWKKLATLVHDVPLRESLADLAFGGVPREAFTAWCADKELASLADRPRRWR